MKDRDFWLQILKFSAVILMTSVLIAPFDFSQALELKSVFPKRANYFLSWDLSEEQARELAKWDLVILDMEHQVRNREKILEMRRLNPNIVILAYLATQEIFNRVPQFGDLTPLRMEIWKNIQPEWWLRRSNGEKVGWWPGTWLLNITDAAPAARPDAKVGARQARLDEPTAGQRWADYLADFVAGKILASGLWDGMFFDNTWNSLTNKVGSNLDINGDGLAEPAAAIEQSYQSGMNNFFSRVRELTANRYPLIGLDGDDFVSLDGLMLENFPYARGWTRMMKDGEKFSRLPGRFILLNANTANAGGRDDYPKMRFGLVSALLNGSYYSFDLGDRDHGQIWWYDEYDVYLGEPAGIPFLVKNGTADFSQTGLWRRDFKQGAVLVNSGEKDETIELNAEFEKLKGRQDAAVNDGLIVSSATIPPGDGLILLRPIERLFGAPFRNGSFARVLNRQGEPIRNGFFAYDSRFKGGQTLLIADLDNDGEEETVAAKGNAVKIYKGASLWKSFRPFALSFRGEVALAAADVNQDGQSELIVGRRSQGSKIKIYDLSGRQIGRTLSAFSKSSQGVNLAAADFNGDGQIEIAAGAAQNSSQVKIFSQSGKLLSQFFAYGKKNQGGVNLAAGDLDADGRAEIVAGRAKGAPEIRIFDQRGKQKGRAFLGAGKKGKDGIAVAVSDVDGDGAGEIISLSSEVFTTAMK